MIECVSNFFGRGSGRAGNWLESARNQEDSPRLDAARAGYYAAARVDLCDTQWFDSLANQKCVADLIR